VLPVFRVLQERGAIATDEMFRAFNMGIGLIVVCAPDAGELAIRMLRDAGETAAVIGHVVAGNRNVQYMP
jgi:phosphoribosylformylglycinamidine cyclo-ligase